MPYTYLIMCIATGQVYYGVRYAKGCHPDDLWSTYFTSSKYVKELITKYGKAAFIYEIRKTFTDAKSARDWEHKVLKRMDVTKRDEFINRTDNKSIQHDQAGRDWNDYYGPERASVMKQKLVVKRAGRKHSPETIVKMRASAKGHTHARGPRNRSSYIIEGTRFRTLDNVASAYGIGISTIHYRVNSNTEQFSNWIKEN
jgi:hypothetical protein